MNCSNRKGTVSICVVALIIVVGVGYYIFKPKEYETFEDLLVLEYGDKCSPEISGRWENASASILLLVEPASQPLENWVLQQAFLDHRVELCNPYENLICNKISAKCTCGDSKVSAIFGEASAPKKFVAERGPGSGSGRSVPRKCRWAQNTFCFPSNYTNSVQDTGKVLVDLACTDGTTCKSKWNGKECTLETIKHYSDYYGVEKVPVDIVSGKICTCQPNHPAIGVLAVLH